VESLVLNEQPPLSFRLSDYPPSGNEPQETQRAADLQPRTPPKRVPTYLGVFLHSVPARPDQFAASSKPERTLRGSWEGGATSLSMALADNSPQLLAGTEGISSIRLETRLTTLRQSPLHRCTVPPLNSRVYPTLRNLSTPQRSVGRGCSATCGPSDVSLTTNPRASISVRSSSARPYSPA
jgi:hypothetical protein